MRHVPLERDINIAINGPFWVEVANPEHPFTAMLISRSRGTCLINVSYCAQVLETSGHDLESALYNFLDEWLFNFCAEPFFVPFKIEINEFTRTEEGEGDSDRAVCIKSVGIGETFTLERHPQGTEVKAITYSAMQINEEDGFAEVFVIIDI